MQKSVLQVLIEKASGGDSASLKKLSNKLCDRLVFVPFAQSSELGGRVKISVIRVRESGRKIIPVFLSQQSLQNWLRLTELKGQSMSLYCPDILKAVGPDHWVMLEAGAPAWVEIDPGYTESIRLHEPSEEDLPLEPIRPIQKKDAPPPTNLTQEVPIVPHPITTKAPHQSEPERSSGLKRFRHEDEDDMRATMDLTSLMKRK